MSDILEKIRKRPVKDIIWTSAAFSLFFGILGSVTMYYEDPNLGYKQYLIFFIFITAGMFSIYLSVFKPYFKKYIAGIGVIVFMIFIPSMMFDSEAYAKFLRVSGFGGGKEVSVFFESENAHSSNEMISGGLLIRTAEFLLIFTNKDKEIVEIPLYNVRKIVYPKSNEYQLPDK